MKTTVDIPEQALLDAMRFTKAKTKHEAILTVIEDFNRRHRMAELTKFSGTCKSLMRFEELMAMRGHSPSKSAQSR